MKTEKKVILSISPCRCDGSRGEKNHGNFLMSGDLKPLFPAPLHSRHGLYLILKTIGPKHGLSDEEIASLESEIKRSDLPDYGE